MEQQPKITVYQLPEYADFSKDNTISAIDEKGKPVRYVQLSEGSIAKVRNGKGRDVEQATMIAGGNQAKYFSAMMASVSEIEGKPVVMEDLGELDARDYLRIQMAFTDINF